MLKSITIENFKSFGKKQSLPLAPLTLMIGANASGKSNAIEAFRFLSFLAEGQKLSTIQHNIDDSNKIFRGSSRDLGHHGAKEFTLGCEIEWPTWNKFLITLGRQNNGLKVLEEEIFEDERSLYSVEKNDTGKVFPFQENRNVVTFKDGLILDIPNITSVMGHIENLAALFDTNNPLQFEALQSVELYQIFLKVNLFIDPIPSKMRGDSVPEKTLRNDCSNLAGVLQTLWAKEENREPLLNFIKSLPEQNFTDIRLQDDRRGRYFFELVETFGGEERPVLGELLSDGTLRVLAIAAALLSAPENSTVVIEEVDNGIHPSRAHELLAMMLEKAKERKIRLLLTTHNPALMDALPDEALGDVVFSYRDPKDGDSRLVRLSDLDDYEGLVFQGPLGTLVTNGIVDRFVKNPVSAEEQKEKDEEWLERMRGIGE